LPGKAVNPYIGVYAGPAVGLSNTGEYFYGTDFIVNVGARLGVLIRRFQFCCLFCRIISGSFVIFAGKL
jgi:hypothetical protein